MDTKPQHLKEGLLLLNSGFVFLTTGSGFDLVKGFLAGVFLQMFSVLPYWL